VHHIQTKEKTNIHIVHSESSLGWGGQEHRTFTELTGLRRRGFRVSLVAPCSSVLYKRASAEGIEVCACRFSRASTITDILMLSAWLSRQGVRVLNTHSSRDGWVMGLAARIARVPLILRTRHIDVDYPSPRISRVAFRLLADHVLTTSQKITEHLGRIFELSSSRISTLATGIDLERFTSKGATSDCIKVGPKPVVGMVSVLRSWKGHGDFLRAAAILREQGFDASFVIVGGGQSPAWIETQVESLGLGDSVTFTGHREDVPEVLRALNVLVIPSTRHEGIPQIGLQALACKTPVVGSDVGGIPEVVRHGETGRIFQAQNPGQLASMIRETIEDAGRTQEMVQSGRRLVEEKYGTDAMLDQLELLYARYISDKNS
jgi:glycosyltransferase involved in cell wall biosynthesis